MFPRADALDVVPRPGQFEKDMQVLQAVSAHRLVEPGAAHEEAQLAAVQKLVTNPLDAEMSEGPERTHAKLCQKSPFLPYDNRTKRRE